MYIPCCCREAKNGRERVEGRIIVLFKAGVKMPRFKCICCCKRIAVMVCFAACRVKLTKDVLNVAMIKLLLIMSRRKEKRALCVSKKKVYIKKKVIERN